MFWNTTKHWFIIYWTEITSLNILVHLDVTCKVKHKAIFLHHFSHITNSFWVQIHTQVAIKDKMHWCQLVLQV